MPLWIKSSWRETLTFSVPSLYLLDSFFLRSEFQLSPTLGHQKSRLWNTSGPHKIGPAILSPSVLVHTSRGSVTRFLKIFLFQVSNPHKKIGKNGLTQHGVELLYIFFEQNKSICKPFYSLFLNGQGRFNFMKKKKFQKSRDTASLTLQHQWKWRHFPFPVNHFCCTL